MTILIPIKENKIKQNQNKNPKESFEFFSIWNRYFISFKLSSINAFVKEINLSDLIKNSYRVASISPGVIDLQIEILPQQQFTELQSRPVTTSLTDIY